MKSLSKGGCWAWLSWAATGWVVVALLAQLFRFERFDELLLAYGLTPAVAPWVAAVIVVVEWLAVPSLLGMTLPGGLTRVSCLAAGVVAVGWPLAYVWLQSHSQSVAGPLWGATLPLPATLPVGLVVLVGSALVARVAWVGWVSADQNRATQSATKQP